MSRGQAPGPLPPAPRCILPGVRGSSRSSGAGSSHPRLQCSRQCRVPCSAPGRVSGSSAVMPSLAEQDPKEQQEDGGCEAHAGEILPCSLG